MRNAIHAFNRQGLDALQAGSSRPREVHAPPSTRAWPRRLYARCSTRIPGSTAKRAVCGPYAWPPRSASKRG
ncbi:MAG: hypothetical protein M3334_10625 [Actinomycetota bacterium]|nr:hypothetical protein [Actinomycetota bacterium]